MFPLKNVLLLYHTTKNLFADNHVDVRPNWADLGRAQVSWSS